jgi:hypothetical protein
LSRSIFDKAVNFSRLAFGLFNLLEPGGQAQRQIMSIKEMSRVVVIEEDGKKVAGS